MDFEYTTLVKLGLPARGLQNPKHGKYRLMRAVVCHRSGKNEQAVEDYTYALENIRVLLLPAKA